MALDNFTNLKTAIRNYLHREDLDAQIPDFITLCEAKLNRELRIALMEQRATATANAAYLELPEDFLAIRNIQVNGDPGYPLTYSAPEGIDQTYTISGEIREYSIIGTKLQFGPAPNADTVIEIDYYKRIPALSEVEPRNWLLASSPDIYLYGAMLEAAPFMLNDARVNLWGQMFTKAVNHLNIADSKDRWTGSALTIRTEHRENLR